MSAEARSVARFFPWFLHLALLLAAAIPAPSAFAKTEAEVEQEIRDVLIQRHPTDTPEWWRGLGPTAPSVIIRMYESTTHIYHRIRLVEGLRWFSEDPKAVEFLKRQAEGTTDDVIRNTAVRAVGTSQGAKEAEFVAKFLKHADPQTRLAAAETLKRMNDPSAKALLDGYLSEEKTEWIVKRVRDGKPPQPRGFLAPVASSEDRVNPAYAGEWKGYWVAPQSGPTGTGMVSEPAVLLLQVPSATELRGELRIATKGPREASGASLKEKKRSVRSFALGRVDVEGMKFKGALPAALREIQSGPSPSPRPVPSEDKDSDFSFEAEMAEVSSGTTLIRLAVPKLGGWLLVRRESSRRSNDR